MKAITVSLEQKMSLEFNKVLLLHEFNCLYLRNTTTEYNYTTVLGVYSSVRLQYLVILQHDSR